MRLNKDKRTTRQRSFAYLYEDQNCSTRAWKKIASKYDDTTMLSQNVKQEIENPFHYAVNGVEKREKLEKKEMKNKKRKISVHEMLQE